MIKKAAELDDKLVLGLLAEHQGQWAFLHNDGALSWHEPTKYPFDSPYRFKDLASGKILMAKFRSLKKRGLCGGCVCGCRGDFEIKDKGLELLGLKRTKPYNGYD